MTTTDQMNERMAQTPEGGRMAFVPKSVLPFIRGTLDWCGAKVSYPRSVGSNRGKCVGHVLDVRLAKNGNAQMLVNCYLHTQHKPVWKRTMTLQDYVPEE